MAKKSKQASKPRKTGKSRITKKSRKSADAGISAIDISKLPTVSDPTLRMLWVDRMQLHVRGDQPIAQMRFFAVLGDESVTEVARLQMSHGHLAAIADLICRSINHYPEKPS